MSLHEFKCEQCAVVFITTNDYPTAKRPICPMCRSPRVFKLASVFADIDIGLEDNSTHRTNEHVKDAA